jgi:uncharacterized repeat protein (TIGR01451 family)
VKAQGIFALPIPAEFLVYDPVSKRLYVSVRSNGPDAYANSIVAIDPVSGKVTGSAFVGDSPGMIALGAQSKNLFVVVAGGTSYRKVELPSLKAGPLYPITEGWGISNIQTYPFDPEGVLIRYGQSRRYNDKFGVFINGQQRGDEAGCGGSIVCGIDSTRLFGYQNQLSSWDFTSMEVYLEGVSAFNNSGSVLSGATGFIGTVNGVLISEGMGLLDPERRQWVGKLDIRAKEGSIIFDPLCGMIHRIMRKGKAYEMYGADTATGKYVGSLNLNLGDVGDIRRGIRFENDGWALATEKALLITRFQPRPVLPQVDMTVTRPELPKRIGKNGEWTYTLTVTNKSSQGAREVFLSDTIPAGVEVTSVSASQGTVVAADGIIRADLGSVAPQQSATVQVEVVFRSADKVRFSAVVRGTEPDPDTTNNIATLKTLESVSPLPDLAGSWDQIRQLSEGSGINLQTALYGKFTVVNQGKATARACVVRFYLGDSRRFRVEEARLLQEFRIPSLRPGASHTLEMNVPLGGADVTGLWLFASIDPAGAVAESNKGNNGAGTKIP